MLLIDDPDGFVLVAADNVPAPIDPVARPATENDVDDAKLTTNVSLDVDAPFAATTLLMIPLLLVLDDARRPAKSNGESETPLGVGYGVTTCRFVVGPKKSVVMASSANGGTSTPLASFNVNVMT